MRNALSPARSLAAAGAAAIIAITSQAAAAAAATGAAHAAPAPRLATGPSWHVVKSVPSGRQGIAITALAATGKTTAWAFAGNGGAAEPTAWMLRNGTWAKAPFPGRNDEEVLSAAATSPDDVWAFTEGFTTAGTGVLSRVLRWNGRAWSVVKTFLDVISEGSVVAANDVWVFGEGQQNDAWHYNGHTWTYDGGDVNGGSALGADDAWGYTGTFVEHWPGRKWVAVNLAGLLPPRKPGSNDPTITGILALSPSDVYATGNGYALSGCGPTVILHYNGRTWRRVAEGSFGCGPVNQQIVPDGRGGLWLPMPDIDALPPYFARYSGGKLTEARLPAGGRFAINAAALVPGTTRALAGGYAYKGTNWTQALDAVILQYS